MSDLRRFGGRKPKSPEYRFWHSFVISDKGCWEWIGRSKSGRCKKYGRIKVNKKQVMAHRFSWEMFNKKAIPPGMMVLHKCDNPSCVKPSHLFLGTHQDNMDDMKNKGRSTLGMVGQNRGVNGSSNHKAKLDEEQVRRIRLDERSAALIAREYNVSKSSINNIKAKKVWRHV